MYINSVSSEKNPCTLHLLPLPQSWYWPLLYYRCASDWPLPQILTYSIPVPLKDIIKTTHSFHFLHRFYFKIRPQSGDLPKNIFKFNFICRASNGSKCWFIYIFVWFWVAPIVVKMRVSLAASVPGNASSATGLLHNFTQSHCAILPSWIKRVKTEKGKHAKNKQTCPLTGKLNCASCSFKKEQYVYMDIQSHWPIHHICLFSRCKQVLASAALLAKPISNVIITMVTCSGHKLTPITSHSWHSNLVTGHTNICQMTCH